MDRRNFLRGLIGSSVALIAAPVLIEEVSRIYSFPTNIVVPSFEYKYQTWDHNGLQDRLVKYYDKNFIKNLKKITPFVACGERHPIPRLDGKPHLFMYIPEVALAA
jgi:hypothetical protein